MKKNINLLFFAFLFASCASVKQIGQLNMVADRNVDFKENYVLIKTYEGLSIRDKKKLDAINIQGAIDNTVKNVPGGEFIMNAKIYLINGQYFSVEGDVWGLQASKTNFQGFHIGDKVQWTATFQKITHSGVITDFKDTKYCEVKDDNTGKIELIKFTDLLKL